MQGWIEMGIENDWRKRFVEILSCGNGTGTYRELAAKTNGTEVEQPNGRLVENA